MPGVECCRQIPEGSLVGSQFTSIDYVDSFSIDLADRSGLSIDYIFASFANYSPKWVVLLLNLRNFLLRPFGLKKGEEESSVGKASIVVGEKFGIMRICARNEEEIVFGETDKHLDFQASFRVVKGEKANLLYCTTVVRFNNVFGKMYFVVIKPFHRLIIRTSLQRLNKVLAAS
jgi:hypothetical protein